MKLTIHRGAAEVGGTCIEVESKGTRIVLDIGMPLFGKDRLPLDSMKLKRLSKEELHELGYLPQVKGMFDGAERPDAILLSHAHLDHTGLVEHSAKEIPIYASKGTSKMMLAGKLFAGQVELKQSRFSPLTPKQSIQIGNFKISVFPVDHSIYGCLATLIEADGKSILYPGDIRLHGRKPGMMWDLVNELRDKTIDVLLMEGTHFGFPDGERQSEYELETKITKLIADAPGLALASFSPQHVDRLVAFIRAAIKTNRTFVVDVYTAFVMHLIKNEVKLPQPSADGPIRVFYPTWFLQSCERKKLNSTAERFQKSRIEISEMVEDPSKYLMAFRPSMLQSDFDGQLPPETFCIYSRWDGYLKNGDWKDVLTAIDKVFGRLEVAHTSGHILSSDIVRYVKAIEPKTVIPVHTFEPQAFSKHFENAKQLSDGVEYEIE